MVSIFLLNDGVVQGSGHGIAYDVVVLGVACSAELKLPWLLNTVGAFFLKMFFISNSTLGRTRGWSGLGLGPAKNRLNCSTTRSESSAFSKSMSLLGAKTLSENKNKQTISTYRKVASTNASRFVTRLVYMHTQNVNFFI